VVVWLVVVEVAVVPEVSSMALVNYDIVAADIVAVDCDSPRHHTVELAAFSVHGE
jgi:hypothetical protein